MPDTVHCLSIWNIFAKILKKLKGLDNHYDEAKNVFVSTVLDSLTKDRFEAR